MNIPPHRDPANLPPKFPLSRVIREGTIGTCKICGSTENKKYVFFGKSIGCINEECENYFKHKSLKVIRREKLVKIKKSNK